MIRFEPSKKVFNQLYNDLIKDEERYYSENFIRMDKDICPSEIGTDDLEEGHYKWLRMLGEYFNEKENK
jgi:hypothetical protein